MSQISEEIDAIEAGLTTLHRVGFQHKTWEDIQQRAGITLDRSSVALLKVVAMCGKESCRMQDIALHLGIEAPSVTRKVQELEQDGLLRRKTDQTDRRVSHVQITPLGADRLHRLQQARREQLNSVICDWPSKDRLLLAKLFRRLTEDMIRMQNQYSNK